MKTSKVISVNVVGDSTGRSYSGDFTVKMVMTQRDEFHADLRRRQILGPSPDGTPPASKLQWDAFMLGQIQARTVESPKFWQDSDFGMDLEDSNVATAVYNEILKAEDEFKSEILKDSEEALEKLKKKSAKEAKKMTEE